MACVCGCSTAGIAGLNPAEGMNAVLIVVGLCDELITRSEKFYRVCVI
jgi:hypothetical protein